MTEPALPAIRLTDYTECGGCAAKLGADLLAEALAGLGAGDAAGAADPALIAGLAPPDDAAAWRVSDDLAILGTLDFFPPLVDDPAEYGEIAAANALSDVFAMGGRVLFALSIAAFPEGFPRGSAGDDPRGGGGEGARGGRPAGGRAHDPGPRAEVRAGRDRRRAPGPAAAKGRRDARRRARCSRNAWGPGCW